MLLSSYVQSKECGKVHECVQSAAESAATAVSISKTLVPKGAVMAFALDDCPDKWSIYPEARGVFIRGIDPTGGTEKDPDGKRNHGHYQSDSFMEHAHSLKDSGKGHWEASRDENKQRVGDWEKHSNPVTSSKSGGKETRPKNVALLYCIKD